MRHRIEGKKFGKIKSARQAMLNNLVISLITHNRIKTTLARAKESRRIAERLITYGKKNTVHARRLAYKILKDRSLVKKLFDEIAPEYIDRNGGYTRIVKMGFRKGDAAPRALLEFVESTGSYKGKEKIKASDIAKDKRT
ncbi:MAG: 50S ribosomal protein L17 [Candidatus Cloacimonadota bacterium]|nr:MAG: 50S ribosomal protein L17 [Candidatus Cloacimonadota bacterium]